jgi:hypothetical protein
VRFVDWNFSVVSLKISYLFIKKRKVPVQWRRINFLLEKKFSSQFTAPSFGSEALRALRFPFIDECYGL